MQAFGRRSFLATLHIRRCTGVHAANAHTHHVWLCGTGTGAEMFSVSQEQVHFALIQIRPICTAHPVLLFTAPAERHEQGRGGARPQQEPAV